MGALCAGLGGYFGLKFGLAQVTRDVSDLRFDMERDFGEQRVRLRDMESEHRSRMTAAEGRLYQHEAMFGIHTEKLANIIVAHQRFDHQLEKVMDKLDRQDVKIDRVLDEKER